MKDKTIPERLAVIETEIANIKETLDDIKNNHLNSICKKFVCLEKKMTSRLPLWVTMIITFLTSLCVGLIVYGVMRK